MIKYIALITTILFAFTSCNFQDSSTDNSTLVKGSIEQVIHNIPEHKVTVIVYDECEYLIYKEDKDGNSSYGLMAHKGNCSNPIHECK